MNIAGITDEVDRILEEATCEFFEQLLKPNSSLFALWNITDIPTLRPDCEPKPYPSVQGPKKWIATTILILFLIFGLIGNLLSATIMFRRARRGLSSYFYLALLAIIDICVLYTSCLLYLLEVAFDYHPQASSTFFCRSISYIQHLFTYISAWLIVAVTFERFIVVRFPFQSIRVCRLHVAYRTATIIVLFFSLYTIHCFFTMDLVSKNLQTDEGYHPNYIVCDPAIYQYILSFIDLCLYSVMPSILILIFNILIIITMFHALKKRRDYLQANGTGASQRNKNKSSSTMRTQFFRSPSAESSPVIRSTSQTNKQRIHHNSKQNKLIEQNAQQKNLFDPTSATGRRLTCLLLGISIIYVVCTLPVSIRPFIADKLTVQISTANVRRTELILTVIMFLNHSINFVLYCLSGRAFRNECRKLLCRLWLLKNVQISCTTTPDSDKDYPYYHQQLAPLYRTRHIPPQYQQRNNILIKEAYL